VSAGHNALVTRLSISSTQWRTRGHARRYSKKCTVSGVVHTWRMAASSDVPPAPNTTFMFTKPICSSAVLSAGAGLNLRRHDAFSLSDCAMPHAPLCSQLRVRCHGAWCLRQYKRYEEVADLADADDDDLIKAGLKKPEIRRLRRYIAEA